MAKIIPFPRKANPNITEVLQEFVSEQHRRVKPPTGRKYEQIIYLLMDSLDTFGPDDLAPEEKTLYNRLLQQGKVDFCDIFGPDKIIRHYGIFFGHFLPRFSGCTGRLMQSASTVTRRLAKWLAEKDHISREELRRSLGGGIRT